MTFSLRMASSMFMKISNKESPPSLQRFTSMGTATSSFGKTLFETNRSKFYAGRNGDQSLPEMIPDSEEAKHCQENVWGEESAHQQGVEWLKKQKEKVKPGSNQMFELLMKHQNNP